MKNVLALATLLLTATLAHAQFPDLNSLKKQLNDKVDAMKPKDPNGSTAAPAETTTVTTTSTTTSTVTTTAPTAAAAPAPKLGTGPVTGTLRGQGAEMTTCEKMEREPGTQWDTRCAKPTKTFAYKGSVTNVGATFRFTPAMTSRTTQFKVILYKADGVEMDQYREITFNTGGKTSQIAMTVTPGTYIMKLVDQFDTDKVALSDTIVVLPDTVGDRATENIKTGIGKLMVCSEIDDNWKCLNESSTWVANKPFNLYVRLPSAIAGQTAGWVIFRQLPDGTDGQFVEDMLQGTNGRAAYWATTGGHTLPAGKYTIYSIAWQERTSIGNLTKYFAKTTLTVQ